MKDMTNELLAAIDKGDIGETKKLLAAGANPNGTYWRGGSLLHYAVANGRDDEEGLGIIRLLLEFGADVNNPAGFRMAFLTARALTPLHVATATRDKWQAVRLLLEFGARVDVQDSHGNTPLHNAAWQPPSKRESLLLLAAGARTDLVNREGKTADDYWPGIDVLHIRRTVRKLGSLRPKVPGL